MHEHLEPELAKARFHDIGQAGVLEHATGEHDGVEVVRRSGRRRQGHRRPPERLVEPGGDQRPFDT